MFSSSEPKRVPWASLARTVKNKFMEVKILSIHGSGLKREVKFRPSLMTQNKTNRNKISCQDFIEGFPKFFYRIFPE